MSPHRLYSWYSSPLPQEMTVRHSGEFRDERAEGSHSWSDELGARNIIRIELKELQFFSDCLK
jgi:hypothetical protein